MKQRSTKLGREIDKAVRAAGGMVTVTADGHLRVAGPSGIAVIGPHAAGRGRSLGNILAQIERDAGLVLGKRRHHRRHRREGT